MAGAVVVIEHRDTGLRTTVETTAAGTFARTLLPLGTYDVTATAPGGFGTDRREGLVLRVGETLMLSLGLAPVELEGITVTREPGTLLATEDVTSSQRFSEEVVGGLPSNGRNFLDFTLLTPGVSISQGPDGDELNVSGQRGIFNNFIVDGADFNNAFLWGAEGRPASRLHLQPGCHRGGCGGQPGRNRRVRAIRGWIRERRDPVGHERLLGHGPRLRPVGRHLGCVSRGPGRRQAGVRTGPVRVHGGRAGRARPRLLLPRLRPADRNRDQAAATRGPKRSQPARAEELPSVSLARALRLRVRPHRAHRRRAGADRQAGCQCGRAPPGLL